MGARNDNHGGRFLHRIQVCVNALFTLSRKYELDVELIIVEWNPPLNRPSLAQALSKGGTIEGVRKAQAEGLIKHGLGFTFHGDATLFKAAVDTREFLCATVSYNLTKRRQEELLDYAAAHGVGVIIMNPLAGGVLTRDDPSLSFLRQGEYGPWYGALRFLLANESITTAIVGYRRVQEVGHNVLL